MTLLHALGGGISLALSIYLLFALLYPEKLS